MPSLLVSVGENNTGFVLPGDVAWLCSVSTGCVVDPLWPLVSYILVNNDETLNVE